MFWSFVGLGTFIYGIFYLVMLCFIDCDVQLAFYEKFGRSIRHLKSKVVFITGASSGIGEHTAYALAKHGVKLVLAARRKHELERVKKNCLEMSKGMLTDKDVLVLPMDLLDLASHRKHFDEAVRHFGGIDVLFNNAGRSQRCDWDAIDIRVDKELFELDVFSVVNLSRVASAHFKQRGGGHFAVTSSTCGVVPVPHSTSYTAAKHALHGYFHGLRIEKMHENIAVTICCPGPTFSNFLNESFTGTPGQKYGVSVQPTDKRMSGERCGELCAIAITNKLPESWMAIFPILPLQYLAAYFPMLFNLLVKITGNKLFKLRDSEVSTAAPNTEVYSI